MSEVLEQLSEVKEVGDRRIHLIKEDVTLAEVDAFVYYARPDLVLGSGFGGAIAVRGGHTIQEELNDLAPVATCDVVVSDAGELKAKHILHAVGPRFQEPDQEEKLRKTIRNTLAAAVERKFETVAFPPMGAGFYGFSLADSARVMFEEIEDHLAGETTLTEVRVCVMDRREFEPFQARLTG